MECDLTKRYKLNCRHSQVRVIKVCSNLWRLGLEIALWTYYYCFNSFGTSNNVRCGFWIASTNLSALFSRRLNRHIFYFFLNLAALCNPTSAKWDPTRVFHNLDFAFSCSLSTPSSPCPCLLPPFLSVHRVWVFLNGVRAAATECFFYWRDSELQSPLMLLPYCTSTPLRLLLMTFFVSPSIPSLCLLFPLLAWMKDSWFAITWGTRAENESSFPFSPPISLLRPSDVLRTLHV